jgi:hypothetical protein
MKSKEKLSQKYTFNIYESKRKGQLTGSELDFIYIVS